MKRIAIIPILLLLLTPMFAANPVVSNINIHSDGTQIIISYDLSADDDCDVRILISNDGGIYFNIYPTAVSGDIGEHISSGAGKIIRWNPAGDGLSGGGTYKVRVIARDNPPDAPSQTQSFVRVEEATFYNGASDITLSPYFIDAYEITQAEFAAVMGFNPSVGAGFGVNHPVYYVTWFDAIEYCNRRSMQEGLTPCYSYSSYGTNPADWPGTWNRNFANHQNVACNWSANGYRLPTEMEWMFAAKGGTMSSGGAYSGAYEEGDLEWVAWYLANSFALGASDPDYGTHAVGTRDPNELGLYDMSGNVWEWTWDIYQSLLPTEPQTNPTGGTATDIRTRSGGSWRDPEDACRIDSRGYDWATYRYDNLGFRVCRAIKVATPMFDPAPDTYATEQQVSLICATEGATIRYTTNGTTPTASSAIYTTPITINSTTTIKAKAFLAGWDSSQVGTGLFTIDATPKVSTPSFLPVGGTYSTVQNVTIRCGHSGTTIRYTTDGSEPLEDSAIYADPIEVSSTTTLKAKAFKAGWLPSNTGTATYTFSGTAALAKPLILPSGGVYSSAITVQMSCSTLGADIRYTTDGSEPNAASMPYIVPFSIATNRVVKAKSFRSGLQESQTTTVSYTFQVATPTFSHTSGNYYEALDLVISCSTAGSVIRYTTDGSEPTAESAEYTDPIAITETTVVKAKAFKEGILDSATATTSIDLNLRVAAPTFAPPAGSYHEPISVTISTTTEGASINYTTTGLDPNATHGFYSDPVYLSSDTTLKAFARKTGMVSSLISSGLYTFSAAPPIFSPPGGVYTEPQVVSISCATANTLIRYTTDGSLPTNTSPQYTEPIEVSTTTLIRAKAFFTMPTDWAESEVVSEYYSFEEIGLLGGMVYIPGGTFNMGNTSGHLIGEHERDAEPVHTVTVSQFMIGRYEITQGEFEELMGDNPATDPADADLPYCNTWYEGAGFSWHEALMYCNLRSMAEGLTPVYTMFGSTDPGDWIETDLPYWDIPLSSPWNNPICNWNANGYRLPTEAEWEFAARGGANTPDFRYSGSDNPDEVAWYRFNSGWDLEGGMDDPDWGIKEVGTKAPNALGIYDMSGNAPEWCWDKYKANYYAYSPSINPRGPSTYHSQSSTEGQFRVKRGGSWYDRTWEISVSARYWGGDNLGYHEVGFRVARSILSE